MKIDITFRAINKRTPEHAISTGDELCQRHAYTSSGSVTHACDGEDVR